MGSTGSLFSDESTEGEQLSEDQVFSILSNRRRRLALHTIRQVGATDLSSLAEQVAAWENDSTVEELTTDERKRVYTSLQQVHLPRMDEADVVAFDKDRGTVEATEAAEELDIYLEVVQGNDIPWHKYYVGFSAVGSSLLIALSLDVSPFTTLPDLAWMAFFVAALLVSAGAHTLMASKRRLEAETPPTWTDQ
mgnify:CR=1 FL=1